MTHLLYQSLLETLAMVFASLLLGIAGGLPLGVFLFNKSPQGLTPSRPSFESAGFFINALRSIPYIILTVLFIPLSRTLLGTSIGTTAAILPLAISAILLTTKVVEDALRATPKEMSEMGLSLGATQRQIITRILIPEALPNIIRGLTLVTISLIGFSAMAGAVGGGGLGDVAIRYGYQRYNTDVLLMVVALLIVLVQVTQWTGDELFKKCNRK